MFTLGHAHSHQDLRVHIGTCRFTPEPVRSHRELCIHTGTSVFILRAVCSHQNLRIHTGTCAFTPRAVCSHQNLCIHTGTCTFTLGPVGLLSITLTRQVCMVRPLPTPCPRATGVDAAWLPMEDHCSVIQKVSFSMNSG